MKRFLPKSLVGQLLALVAFMLLVAQAINMSLLYQAEQQRGLQQAASAALFRLVTQLDREETRSRIVRRQPRARPFRVRPLLSDSKPITDGEPLLEMTEQAALALDNMGINARSIEISQQETVPFVLEDHVIKQRQRFGRERRALAREMKQAGEVQDQRSRSFLVVSMQLDNDQWLSIASAVRDRRMQILRPLIFQTLVTYLILLVPLILLGRYISKPLKSLTQAAENFQAGEANNVAQGGPPDVRKLISAHNGMSEKVNIMLNEKDVMLGAIGHDLRTPLAALRVRIESVEDDDERERMASVIADMDQTLEDILSLARVGRSSEGQTISDINALIETVVDEFVDLGHDVNFDREGRIVADVKPALIRRALRNLISNGVKYGKSVRIYVRAADGQIQIDIEDNGPGIIEGQIEAMFEPFARAEKSRNRQTGGTGLGLTLARAIVRDQGGDIILQNREEGGLHAQIILPVSDPA